jgi:hypothetical protein
MSAAAKGSCNTCGETFRLRPNGNVPRHKAPWNTRVVCKGSNRPPEASA